MHVYDSDSFVHFHSPYLSLALARDRPFVGFFGVESGGRKRTHLDSNLLRPGVGGAVLLPDGSACGPARTAGHTSSSAAFERIPFGDGAECDCRVAFSDERTFTIRLVSSGKALAGTFFRIAFAPDVSPMSFWAQPLEWDAPGESPVWDIMTPTPYKVAFSLPGVATFPDFGLVSVSASHDVIEVVEELVPDLTNAGLNLGLSNAGRHSARKAFHLGYFALAFRATQPVSDVTLTFRVEPEVLPRVDGIDFTGERFAGLRRCWMNAFTLNPATLTMGDNPILAGTGHLAIHWKSDMAAITPELPGGISVIDFVRHTLERTFREHTDEQGKMRGYGWENGACNLMSLADYVAATGDIEFARVHHETIRRIVEFNLALDADDDGILEAAYHGNHFHDEKTSLNWWDAFAFGHKDAYGNLAYHRAFRRARGVFAALGDTETVARMDSFLGRFRTAFHETFFNPATGVYAGWISRDGRVHDYQFTFITAMAINEGLVDDRRARDMLQRLLVTLEQNGYGSFRWGVPGPAVPVDPDDRTDWAPMADWGRYENGGFCGQTAYHFILALYRVGMNDVADRILFSMLETFEEGPTHSGLNPGFGKSVDWRTLEGFPCGYNYLADNYVFLLAAVEGFAGASLPEACPPIGE